jgi:hypothetical protein
MGEFVEDLLSRSSIHDWLIIIPVIVGLTIDSILRTSVISALESPTRCLLLVPQLESSS